MTKYTTNLNIDLYEDTDKPNLRDQYNSAMGKIDTAYSNQNIQISAINTIATAAKETAEAASTAASAATTAAETATSTANSASTIATSAAATAASAASDATSALNAANQALSQVERNIIVIGDSWSNVNPDNGKWTPEFFALDPSFPTENMHIYAQAGGRVTNEFGTLVNNAVADTSLDAETITDIIFIGGINDVANSVSGSQIYTAMSQYVTTLRTAFENARIYFMMNYFAPITPKQWNAARDCIPSMNSALDMKATALFGVIPMANMDSGRAHPSTSGYKLLAAAVMSFINDAEPVRPAVIGTINPTAVTAGSLIYASNDWYVIQKWNGWESHERDCRYILNGVGSEDETTVTFTNKFESCVPSIGVSCALGEHCERNVSMFSSVSDSAYDQSQTETMYVNATSGHSTSAFVILKNRL